MRFSLQQLIVSFHLVLKASAAHCAQICAHIAAKSRRALSDRSDEHIDR
jgi:hypothetical protein